MKTALIFGSSGLIGNELFKTILLNNFYSKIKVFVRSIPEVDNPKVEIIKTDFSNLEQYKDKIIGDDCFFCIGTTKKDTNKITSLKCLNTTDEDYAKVCNQWSDKVVKLFDTFPRFDWEI